MPKIVEEALEIDEETGTDFWRKGLGNKKMTMVKVAWKCADRVTPEQERAAGKEPSMIGFQEI